MADLSDVLTAVAQKAGALLYPNGPVAGPSPVANIVADVRVGWPPPQVLDAAMADGIAKVTVFPRPGMDRNTSRYLTDDEPLVLNPTTYSAAVTGQEITVSGQAPATFYPQNISLLVNSQLIVIQTQAGQTAAQVAAALATAITAAAPGSAASGDVVTVPASTNLSAVYVGASGSTLDELKREERQIQVTIWSPTPDARAALAKAIDPTLSSMKFITLPDTTKARIKYAGSNYIDTMQKQAIFRRDLFYVLEYATTETNNATQIVAYGSAAGSSFNFTGN